MPEKRTASYRPNPATEPARPTSPKQTNPATGAPEGPYGAATAVGRATWRSNALTMVVDSSSAAGGRGPGAW